MDKALVEYVRENWRGKGDPPVLAIAEDADRFFVTLSGDGVGTVGRLVRYKDFCVRPGTSLIQIIDKLLVLFAKLQLEASP